MVEHLSVKQNVIGSNPIQRVLTLFNYITQTLVEFDMLKIEKIIDIQ